MHAHLFKYEYMVFCDIAILFFLFFTEIFENSIYYRIK